jgi:hypothetical protein
MEMNLSRRRFAAASGGLLLAGVTGRINPASAQDAVPLIVFGDTVQGGKNVPEDQAADKTCVLTSRYPRNSEVVFRVRVIDPTTGQAMDDTTLEKVETILGDGTVAEMDYGGHPPPARDRDFYWTVPWLIPKDYPTGSVAYTVIATAIDGRTGEYKPFDIPSSSLTVTDEVLEDIVEEEE